MKKEVRERIEAARQRNARPPRETPEKRAAKLKRMREYMRSYPAK